MDPAAKKVENYLFSKVNPGSFLPLERYLYRRLVKGRYSPLAQVLNPMYFHDFARKAPPQLASWALAQRLRYAALLKQGIQRQAYAGACALLSY